MERRGLVRTPFLSAGYTNSSFHPLLLWGEVPAPRQPSPCSAPQCRSTLIPSEIHCSLQAPIPYSPSLCAAPQGGSEFSALPWRCCQHCWTPSPSPPCLMPCLPSFCSPSGIIQRTASFLQRGTNSCSCPCSALPFSGGHLLSCGGKKLVTLATLATLVTSPVAFCGGWWTRGGGTGAGAWLLVQLHVQGTCPGSC